MNKNTDIFTHLTDLGLNFEGFPLLMLYVFFALMFIDVITGFLSALYNRRMDSKVGFKGFVRKGGLVMGVALAVLVDLLIGVGFPMFTSGALLYLSANEGLSALENLSKMDVQLPFGLGERLRQTIAHNDQVGMKSEVKTEDGKTVITNTMELPPESPNKDN